VPAGKGKNTPPEHIASEMAMGGSHNLPEEPRLCRAAADIYGTDDYAMLQNMEEPNAPEYRAAKSLDELLDRDDQREKDGFKRKISLGKIVKPTRGGQQKVIVVPTTVEEKFYHDSRVSEDDEQGQSDQGEGEGDTGENAGTAEGEEGDVIGERPLHSEGEGEGTGAGQGSGEDHDIGATAYDLGKILTEKFKLPNLQDKGKKRTVTKYVYDLTDRNRGEGQVLDKKNTLLEIIKTNINLDRFDPDKPIEPAEFLINPKDYVYRIMSKEKDVESQAIVFFLRDYSGSMHGKPTDIVCSQHVMIYSWLMYQYSEQAEARFILHDTDAKEVPDFYTYHNMNVAGGTQIRSSIELVNKIIEDENLARDYNIYIFYGGDGDDWNSDKDAFAKAFDVLLPQVNRFGVTIVRNSYASADRMTEFERFLKEKNILEKYKKQTRLDVIDEDADDKRLIEGIKKLVS
jgi:uncharacterized sporulation protein YeaH/YhbH (DUF444 family)